MPPPQWGMGGGAEQGSDEDTERGAGEASGAKCSMALAKMAILTVGDMAEAQYDSMVSKSLS